MDLRRFIALKTVVEEGSFCELRKNCAILQSTVTFRIQQQAGVFSPVI